MAGLQALTVNDVLDQARGMLAGLETARLDAEVLLAYIMDTGREALYTHPQTRLDQARVSDYFSLLHKRAAGVPVAYLVGTREFWSLSLGVSRDTLIPRPETELLVETALEHIPPAAEQFVLDLGTGSGAIAIAVASERPYCRVVASDIDAAALAMARRNAARLGLANIRFVHSDWFSDLHGQVFDTIISNPPYIDSAYPGLAGPELRYEPRLALDGGHLGLQAYHRIIPAALRHLGAGGLLMLEHGYDQAAAVEQILNANHYLAVTTRTDYAGNDRVTHARRR